MQYTEKDVERLMREVQKEFTAVMDKAESEKMSLAKSEEHSEEHEHKEEKPKHEEHEAKSHEDHEHGEEGHEDEGHDYDQEDMEHMEKMYRSMSKGELKAHHDCLQKCMGGSMSKAEIEACPPGKIPGAKSEASDANGEVNKSEHASGGEISKDKSVGKIPGAKSEASDANGEVNKSEIEACPPGKIPGAKSEASDAHGKEINKSMEKSEKSELDLLKSELEAEKADKASLKKNFDAVQEFLTKLVKKTAPQGKAITSLDVIAKSETQAEAEKSFSKSEIHEILKKKSADPKLEKANRDAINSYYGTGQVNVNSISHLLK